MEPPPPSTDPVAVEGFLKAVLRSGLLDRAQLQDALRDVPMPLRGDTMALAAHLIRGGKLSRFQARRLLKGHWRGLILGPYQVLAPIGRGGMGRVFLARDTRTGELLALKLLLRRTAERRVRARFRREMRLCRQVAHPHLACTYSTGRIEDTYYIAMEYIPGKSLQRLVAADGPLPVARAARLLIEVAAGLEHAHNQGLIHRDLKPSNIMVTPHDHAKVLDLGLAIVEGEHVADKTVVGGKGYVVGTMDYIAPEQTTNAATVDRRADVYSMGCTLYYTVTGRPPFPGGTSKQKIQRQRSEEPESLLDLKPSLPPAFVLLVRRMMAKDPADRPPRAAAVAEELRPWAGDAALPLDRKDDPEYGAAVYALQDEEPATEYSVMEGPSVEEIPDDEPSETPPRRVEIVEDDWEEESLEVRPPWKLVLVVALAILAGLGLIACGAMLVLLLSPGRH